MVWRKTPGNHGARQIDGCGSAHIFTHREVCFPKCQKNERSNRELLEMYFLKYYQRIMD
jgi:hypothetical protein